MPPRKETPSPWSRLWLTAWILLVFGAASACAPTVEAGVEPSLTPTWTTSPSPSFTPSPSPTPTRRPSETPRPSPTATATEDVEPVSDSTGLLEAPVLLYHHIANSPDDPSLYSLSPEKFRAQMEEVKAEGFHPITFSQLAAGLRGEFSLPDHPIVIAFDDGYEDVYLNAYPVLSELGYNPTVNVIVRMLNGPSYLSNDEMRELAAAGWEIGSHSLTHADLTKSSDPIGEICTSKRELEKLLGQKVLTFAYPYGSANPYVMQIVKDCHYTSGGGVGPLTTHSAKYIYFLSRVVIDGAWTMEQFKAILKK
jgi:peptidoglycan/xylan/chitin deacetylase (PgdA/CDA1 family)